MGIRRVKTRAGGKASGVADWFKKIEEAERLLDEAFEASPSDVRLRVARGADGVTDLRRDPSVRRAAGVA